MQRSIVDHVKSLDETIDKSYNAKIIDDYLLLNEKVVIPLCSEAIVNADSMDSTTENGDVIASKYGKGKHKAALTESAWVFFACLNDHISLLHITI